MLVYFSYLDLLRYHKLLQSILVVNYSELLFEKMLLVFSLVLLEELFKVCFFSEVLVLDILFFLFGIFIVNNLITEEFVLE
jgi:hypothetical protein